MSNSANDIAAMTPENARNAACFVAYLLDIKVEGFMQEFFPYGMDPRPSRDDLDEEDLHTYEAVYGCLASLKATLCQVADGTPHFLGYKRLLWWCERVLEGEAAHPSQIAAQCDNDAWARWARVRGIKRGIYRGGRRK